MTLKEYKDKYSLKFDDLERMTGRNRSDLHKWIQEGATVKTRGRRLISISSQPKPPKRLWGAE